MRIFETHAHLLDEAFEADREEVVKKIQAAGVDRLIEACCRETDIEKILALKEKYPFVLPTAGVHPEEIREENEGSLDIIRAALKTGAFYAVGEIGLDYHYEDMAPKELQKRYFDDQLSMAEENGLPVIIHDREAHGDTLDILRAHKGRVHGVMHCFSGSRETAREVLDLGFYLGFGGVATFKSAKKSREVIAFAPMDRLLSETDCPYMAPEPFRGTRNDSSLLPYIVRAMAAAREADEEETAAALYENAERLFLK